MAAHVQSKSTAAAGGGTTIAVTLTAAVTSGNAIAGMVYWGLATDVLTSVTDNQSNTYTLIAADQLLNVMTNPVSACSFYLENITNAPTVITANFSGSAPERGLTVHEASGVATASALRTSKSLAMTNSTATVDIVTTGNPPANSEDGDYVFGAVVDSFNYHAPSWFLAGTGFTEREESGSTSYYPIASEDKVHAGAAALTPATFTKPTVGTSDQAVFVVVLKAGAVALPDLTLALEEPSVSVTTF